LLSPPRGRDLENDADDTIETELTAVRRARGTRMELFAVASAILNIHGIKQR